MKERKIVPDTSVLIQHRLSALVKEGKLEDVEIIIPKVVIDELQAQASRGRDIGMEGLEEIKLLRKLGESHKLTLTFTGERPTLEEITLAKKGRIDALIRDVAAREGATLVTADYVQALVGEAEGVAIQHIPNVAPGTLRIEGFFTPDTQSVHLKAGVKPVAKTGKPGQVVLREIRSTPVEEKELKTIVDEIMTKVRRDVNSFIEITSNGASVVQMGNYRIAIARPPFSDGLELTAVRPIAKVGLADYTLHDELTTRMVQGSRGVLIAGPPGSGKSSFCSALAEFLNAKGKIVKTFEQPRDLQVGPEITQYAPLEGDWEKSAELLLLVRPDYTFFDEIRKVRDFRIFADMRLAGVGMVGVVHATSPVSAIQRFIGKVELGVIPHVMDTVIFIKDGKIEQVYELKLTVKVPTGMHDEDLARPVVVISDFETKKPVYEIYTFGEENLVVPIQDAKGEPSGAYRLAAQVIYNHLRHWDSGAEVTVESDNRATVRVRNSVIGQLIGKGGKTIEEVEKDLGISLNIEPKEGTLKTEVPYTHQETGAYLNVYVHKDMIGKTVDVYNGDRFVLSAAVGKNGCVGIKKNSPVGKAVFQGIAGHRLRVVA